MIKEAKTSETKTKKDHINNILNAATALFCEKGYANVTVQEIADRAGLNKATLYYHMESKEELLFSIFDTICSLLIRKFKEVMKRPIAPAQKLQEIIHAYLTSLSEHPQAFRVFVSEGRELRGEHQKHIHRECNLIIRMVEEILHEGVNKGTFSLPDISIATLAILGMCNWAAHWLPSHPEISVDQVGQTFFYLISQGILT